MSFLMVFTFVVSWAPMQIITIYRFIDSQIVLYENFSIIFFICHWLAVSRSFVNPFIYAFNNYRFRKGFRYFICFYFIKVTPHQYESFMIQSHKSKFSSQTFNPRYSHSYTELFQMPNSKVTFHTSKRSQSQLLFYSSDLNNQQRNSIISQQSRPSTPFLNPKNEMINCLSNRMSRNKCERHKFFSTKSVETDILYL